MGLESPRLIYQRELVAQISVFLLGVDVDTLIANPIFFGNSFEKAY